MSGCSSSATESLVLIWVSDNPWFSRYAIPGQCTFPPQFFWRYDVFNISLKRVICLPFWNRALLYRRIWYVNGWPLLLVKSRSCNNRLEHVDVCLFVDWKAQYHVKVRHLEREVLVHFFDTNIGFELGYSLSTCSGVWLSSLYDFQFKNVFSIASLNNRTF